MSDDYVIGVKCSEEAGDYLHRSMNVSVVECLLE
jgi:hypothetical protein